MNKTCYTCKKEKDIEEFGWKSKPKGIRHGYCRECKKIHQKKYYHKSKEKYIAKILESRQKRRKENLAKAKLYLLDHPCLDCGNSDIRVLHFDHVRGKKYKDVCYMVQHAYGWDKVQKEIDKCEIRCSNCHMLRTWPNRWD